MLWFGVATFYSVIVIVIASAVFSCCNVILVTPYK